MPLINCEINLFLAWSESYVITGKATREDDSDDPDANPAEAAVNNPTNTIFKITNSNLCVPVATLSTEDNNKLLEQLKTGFKRTIKWNKQKPEMSKQTKTNIDTTINKFNRLFLLSFENEDGRTSFSKYYTPSVELKDFDVLTDSKSFFDVPIEIKEETYEKIIEMNKNNDYTTGNLLEYEYFSNHYKLIANRFKQTN